MPGLRIDSTEITHSRPDKPSAAEDAYYRIREMIVTGTLRPGQIVNEQDLVRHLSIGRTPVREAIQRLANQHVVDVFPRRGVAVAKLGLEDVQAIFEARGTIEEKIAELAAVRRTDDEAQAMGTLGERISMVTDQSNFTEFLHLDQQLHHLIAAAARNRFLMESADHLLMLSDWIWHQYFQLRGPDQAHYFAHDAIIRAVVDRDAKSAGSAMREHVRQSREVIRSAM